MNNINNEIVIIGAGMVGQSIAYQLIERKISNKINVLFSPECDMSNYSNSIHFFNSFSSKNPLCL